MAPDYIFFIHSGSTGTVVSRYYICIRVVLVRVYSGGEGTWCPNIIFV